MSRLSVNPNLIESRAHALAIEIITDKLAQSRASELVNDYFAAVTPPTPVEPPKGK